MRRDQRGWARSWSILSAVSQLASGAQRRADTAQCVGVVAEIGAHRRCQGEVLGRRAGVAGAGQGEAKSELGVIVSRTGVDDPAEVVRRGCVLAGVELRPRQRLQYAPGSRLSCGSPFQQLSGGRGTAAAEQVKATLVELKGVGTIAGDRIWSIL